MHIKRHVFQSDLVAMTILRWLYHSNKKISYLRLTYSHQRSVLLITKTHKTSGTNAVIVVNTTLISTWINLPHIIVLCSFRNVQFK